MLPEIESIRRRRVALGLKQKDMMMHSGVSQSYIAKLESGKLEPSYRNMKIILETLDRLERKSEMAAKDIMSTNIIGVQGGEKVIRAVEIMKKKNISQLPVFDGYHVVGTISEKVITHMLMKADNPKELSKQRIGDVMEGMLPKVPEHVPFSAIAPLLEHSDAVLVTRKNRTVGIITKADMLKMVK